MSLRATWKRLRTALIPLALLAAVLGGLLWQAGGPDAQGGDGCHDRTLVGHTCPVRAVAFSADGATLASGDGGPHPRGGEVRFWDVSTGEPRGGLPQRAGQVLALAFSPDGALLATAAW